MFNIGVIEKSQEAEWRPLINTGSPIDLPLGGFYTNPMGGYSVSGGLGLITATIAEANRHKSTLTNSMNVNVLARWPGVQLLVGDTEFSTNNKKRLAGFSTLYLDEPEKRAAHLAELESRIRVYDGATNECETVESWHDYARSIMDAKIKDAKNLTVEFEINNPATGQPYRALIPTLMTSDSWSEAKVKHVQDRNDSYDNDTDMGKMRTTNVDEGWEKTRILRQLPAMCAKGGIYFSMTGHIGEKMAVGNTPNKKDMMYMGQNERVKGMSSKFYYLMTAMLKIANSEAVVNQSDRKLTDYPSSSFTAANELHRLSTVFVRTKNSKSGPVVDVISSQDTGVNNGLTYYDNLRSNKYWGIGTPNSVRSPFLPGVDLGRTKIADMCKQHKVMRALEITWQMMFLNTHWSGNTGDLNLHMTLEQVLDALSANSIAADDILNSRGWWTYIGAKVEREYLSIADIAMIVSGQYKSKFVQVPK